MINIAFIVIIVGVTLLRFTWRKTGIYFTLVRILAWGAIIIAHLLLSNIIGAEFGITFGLSALAISGFAIAFFNREHKGAYITRSSRHTDTRAPLIAAPSTGTIKKTAIFLLVGPFALLSTALLSVFFVTLIPVRFDIKMAIAAFLFPTLYALATYYLCASKKHLKNTLAFSVLSGIAAGYLFL